MIEVRPKAERVLLVGAPRQGTRDAVLGEEHLDKLASLADTAGADVVGRLAQQVRAPTPNFYIGTGKVEELKGMVEERQVSLVVFDEGLSPAQGKNLEQAVGVRVMDRAELILDIFATRARTSEAKMQVELAQLEYTLPRLARMWVHLSRIRGGIGLRGPGETQLETDRRMIRRKISVLKERLEHVARHRETIRRGGGRAGRRDVLTAVLVGYTNTGKSSLLKALTGAEAFIENRLFATLDTMAREIDISAKGEGRAGSPTSRRIRLVDTVGFIRKLPHHLVASFRATLEEAGRANLLLHVIDASHAEWESQAQTVDKALSDLGVNGVRVIPVFNKMDLVEEPEAFRAMVRERFEGAVCVSAEPGRVAELVEALTS